MLGCLWELIRILLIVIASTIITVLIGLFALFLYSIGVAIIWIVLIIIGIIAAIIWWFIESVLGIIP